MNTTLPAWLDLWQRIGAQGDPLVWYQTLISAYSEPHRRYHNLQHLDECLASLHEAKLAHLAPNADAVEVALWFHDAVYDPKAGDNEERSATMARQALEDASVDPAFVDDVVRLILCTKTHETGDHADARWMIDVDLSILGRETARFDQYETQIRAEYSWVPAKIYAEKRVEILASFLAREHLYSTEYFRDRFEPSARGNLAYLIACLQRSAG